MIFLTYLRLQAYYMHLHALDEGPKRPNAEIQQYTVIRKKKNCAIFSFEYYN